MAEIQAGLEGVYPRLWRYALFLSGNQQVAEDLAQSTCVRALEKHDSFTPGTHLDRWLFRIAQRLWLNELRSRTVRRAGGLVAVEDIEIASETPSTESNIFARQVFESVLKLPEAQRVSVLLVYVEGYSYREAANLLEIPIGTVMSRLATARRALKELAADDMRQAGE